MKETATVKIRVKPSTQMKLKRYANKLASKNKVVAVTYDEAIETLLDKVK